MRKRGLTNSDNLLELLKHRVEGGDENLSTALRCGSFAEKKHWKKSTCVIMIRIVIDKNSYYICKSYISAINLIVDSRNMIKLLKNMSL